MDHDRMDPRDRGMSGAEGPPPPPRTTNHRQSDNSRDRRSGKSLNDYHVDLIFDRLISTNFTLGRVQHINRSSQSKYQHRWYQIDDPIDDPIESGFISHRPYIFFNSRKIEIHKCTRHERNWFEISILKKKTKKETESMRHSFLFICVYVSLPLWCWSCHFYFDGRTFLSICALESDKFSRWWFRLEWQVNLSPQFETIGSIERIKPTNSNDCRR